MFDRKNNARLFPFRSSRAGKWSGSLSISCSVLHRRLGGWVGLADGLPGEQVGQANGSVGRMGRSSGRFSRPDTSVERTGGSGGRVGRARFDERTDDRMVVCGDSQPCHAGRSGERARDVRTNGSDGRTSRAGGWPVGHDSNFAYCDMTCLASWTTNAALARHVKMVFPTNKKSCLYT